MPQKYRLTGCAKFFLFLLIAAPLAFFGAYYMNTGDPMSGLRALGIDTSAQQEEATPLNDEALDVDELKNEVQRLRSELEACQNSKEDTLNNK